MIDKTKNTLHFVLVRYGHKKTPHRLDEAFLKNMAATYSPALLCSTIGHERLNFSVRNGKR